MNKRDSPPPAIHFTGERLVPGMKSLRPLRTENLARFNFFLAHAVGDHFLDFGCGTGEGTHFLAGEAGREIAGIDIDFEAVKAAIELYRAQNISFSVMDTQAMAFRSQIFDSIVSIEVIEHIPDPEAYLAEARRLLIPGGCFLLSTPNRLQSSPTKGSLWPEHVREYSPEELSGLLHKFFPNVEMWGECVPVYEGNLIRRAMHFLAPYLKPVLPRWLRIRTLPALQSLIKPNLAMSDVVFTREGIEKLPTLIAICRM